MLGVVSNFQGIARIQQLRIVATTMTQASKTSIQPETFEEALAWVKICEAETGRRPSVVTNTPKGLTFDIENATVTRSVWDEDDNLIEMTYCAFTGRVLGKKVTKPTR